MLDDLTTRKRELRVQLPARVRDPARDAALIERLRDLLRHLPGRVGAVWPLPDEPDLRPLLHKLAEAGRPVLLPAIVGEGRPLVFRAWHPDSVLGCGPFGTAEPPADGPAGTPDLILVPTRAFDRRRNRLGRGGGYYDRTLAAHPSAEAIGFAYADAEIPAVPVGPHDRRLDRVVTERGSF